MMENICHKRVVLNKPCPLYKQYVSTYLTVNIESVCHMTGQLDKTFSAIKHQEQWYNLSWSAMGQAREKWHCSVISYFVIQIFMWSELLQLSSSKKCPHLPWSHLYLKMGGHIIVKWAASCQSTVKTSSQKNQICQDIFDDISMNPASIYFKLSDSFINPILNTSIRI